MHPAAGLTSTAKSAWAGLAAGFLHTLCGPDHLAVGPLSPAVARSSTHTADAGEAFPPRTSVRVAPDAREAGQRWALLGLPPGPGRYARAPPRQLTPTQGSSALARILQPLGRRPLQALTPLTIGRNRFAASALGALWGFGHSTGQLILGLVFVVLKVGA
jgi:hypothetical protein